MRRPIPPKTSRAFTDRRARGGVGCIGPQDAHDIEKVVAAVGETLYEAGIFPGN